MNRSRLPSIILFLVAIGFASNADARMRMRYEDAEVVERSELIVIGAIQEGSIKYIRHDGKPGEARAWEHHAVLEVREVLNGRSEEKQIPVIIHYGLGPLIDGHWKHDGGEMNRKPPAGATPGNIQIIDSGNSVVSFTPLVEEARNNHIWMLRRQIRRGRDQQGEDYYGIVDPEDLQPAALKDYLMCYLAPQPEQAVRERIQRQPELAQRGNRFLTHLEIQRILTEPDASRRVEKLLPYYLSGALWGYKSEAQEGILAAGAVAGPYLLGSFRETHDPARRRDLIRMMGRIQYADCVDVLIDLLKDGEKFWAAQQLEKGWWNSDVESPQTRARRERQSETYYAVCALGEIGDPRAADAIEITRRRWEAINLENNQIVEACDAALKKFGTR